MADPDASVSMQRRKSASRRGEAMNGPGKRPRVVYRRRIAFDDLFEALPLRTEHSPLSSQKIAGPRLARVEKRSRVPSAPQEMNDQASLKAILGPTSKLN